MIPRMIPPEKISTRKRPIKKIMFFPSYKVLLVYKASMGIVWQIIKILGRKVFI